MAESTSPIYRSRPGGFEILPASQSETIEVADGIHLSEGLSNSFLIVTSEGRVVINTGMGFEAPTHRRLYDAVNDDPIRYIILTQGHVDHVGGVDVLRDEGTEIVAQARNQKHQADDALIAGFRGARSSFAFASAIAQSIAHVQAHSDDPIPAQSKPVPTITFDDRHAFELGGTRFELIAVPGGETLDSLIVWLPDRGICFSGNLFSALFGHFPNLVTIRGDRYREAPEFVASLDRVLALEPELLLPGHHGPVRGKSLIRDELLRLRGAVEYVHDKTLEGMNRGADVRSLMREIVLPPELEVGQGYGKVAWSVRAIWETYAGWFHHESTSELYPVAPSAIHSDLIGLCGGANALAERAGARVDAGHFVEGIQLAEIVLSQEPDHPGALEATIVAHRGLEKLSVNFWETSWLRKQIADCEARLATR